jgi:hypothetical protein
MQLDVIIDCIALYRFELKCFDHCCTSGQFAKGETGPSYQPSPDYPAHLPYAQPHQPPSASIIGLGWWLADMLVCERQP